MPNIKFTFVIQHGSVNVKLHNVCFLGLLVSSFALFDDTVELVNLVNDCDTSTLIAILSRLNYPDISGFFLLDVTFLLLLLFGLFRHHLSPSLIILDKPSILGVFDTLSDVEG